MALSKSVIDFILPSGNPNPPAYSWGSSIWGQGPLFISKWAEDLNTSIKKEWGDRAGLDGSSLILCGATIGHIKDNGIEMYLLLPDGKPLLMHKDSKTLHDDVSIAISYHLNKTARDMMLDDAWAEFKRKSRKVSSELFVTRKASK